jgi:phospholipid/cholesterol/gamma-HCH transport system permease protein
MTFRSAEEGRIRRWRIARPPSLTATRSRSRILDVTGTIPIGASTVTPGRPPWEVAVERIGPDACLVRFTGSWRLRDHLPRAADVLRTSGSVSGVRRLAFDTTRLGAWDTGLLTFIRHLLDESERAGIEVDRTGLPVDVEKLLELAAAVPTRLVAREPVLLSWLWRAGTAVIATATAGIGVLGFTGEACAAFAGLFTGRVKIRWPQFALLLYEIGVRALPIITLIGTLIGIILAFGAVVQLRQLGVQIFVADLVGISVAREVGALITAIVLAGRTGAAFAAQLGSMQVNEEIDALTTAGISPVHFLVLPRMLALILMTPLLTIYTDLFGIVGGGLVAVTMLDLSAATYVTRLVQVVTLLDFGMGLARASVFGVLIALAGCLRGMQSGRSAEAVGLATTSAVVTSIVLTIIADGLLGMIFSVLRL